MKLNLIAKTLEIFEFGPSFFHWFVTLYMDTSPTTLNNICFFTDLFLGLAVEFAKGTIFHTESLFTVEVLSDSKKILH